MPFPAGPTLRTLTAPSAPGAALILIAALVAAPMAEAQSSADTFDVVVANGRVIDPETGLDGIRSIGIRDGRIEAISQTPLRGRTVLDASGLVVAPGFIDLHAHGQDLPAARMQAFDGVTTALELEAGTLPIAAAYERVAREGRPINYGFSASWLFARIAEKEGMEPTGALSFFQEAQRRTGWQHSLASPDETARIIARVERGLRRARSASASSPATRRDTDARRPSPWRNSRPVTECRYSLTFASTA